MPDHRNILLIQTDEHHRNMLAFRGAPGSEGLRTPHLDRLARERAVVFNNAYSCSGVCVPSRVSLMSGRYPIGHGVMANNITPRPDAEPWLGRLLAGAGYQTGYFGKTHFAGNDDDLASEGWNTSFIKHQYKDYLKAHGVNAVYPEQEDIDKYPVRYWTFGKSRIPEEHYFENVIADQACTFIDQNKDEPFACYVSNVAPHGPFTVPGKYADMYDPADMPLLPRFDGELDGKPPQTRQWIEQNAKYLNDDELRIWMAVTFGLISMVDDNVGKLMAALERNNLLDSTLIVFLSDHGDFASRYGIIGKSYTMTDDLLRVPMMIAAPGIAPRESNALVQSIDITHTLLEWAGIEPCKHQHGRNLLPLLRGETDRVRDAVFAADCSEYSEDHLYMTMICDGSWKYIESTGFEGELYNLVDDPWETRNLVANPACADTVARLRKALLQWHVQHSGGYFDPKKAAFWEDETLFYDETKYCGLRIKKIKGGAPTS